jgi:hypothetical protein
MTEGGDIAFRVFYKHEKTGLVDNLFKSERVDSHLLMEEGVIVCELAGKCKQILTTLSKKVIF